MLELTSPVSVDLEVSAYCPYRCFFCQAFMGSSQIGQCNTSEYFEILRKLSEHDVFYVFLTGGEPLLNKDLSLIYKYASDLGLTACISTNAFVANDNKISELARVGVDHVQVSIQGPEGIHEKIVGLRKQGAYKHILLNVQKFIQANISVEVACVGLKENFPHIPKLIQDVADVGVKSFRILRYVPLHPEGLKHIPPKEIVNSMMPIIQNTANKCKVALLASVCPGFTSEPNLIPNVVHPMTNFCPAGKISMAILSNGDVYPCQSFKLKSEMRVGNILRDTISDLWNNYIMLKMRKLSPADYQGICANCSKKWNCYSARCIAYSITRNLYGDDFSCYIVRDKYR